ncbi:hypothetical protein M2212_007108 [Bradyrhizobium elkanii]|uniref:AlbA family DNA-binding domain-containing protein n=1 Tax=Bradyrhizobium elkanii TaxID=29448 RepID=UPI002166F6B4|nr:ATP-binding protein [Bradyrhizobium elkanii]MCS3480262.1 hypothetical protein [Bradyrhizobium elkanii]
MSEPTNQFDQLTWDAIEAFVRDRQEENLHLDFKTVANSELTNKDDKRNLASAISGFANSDGGLIIWGVDARKNADGVDCATSIIELSNPLLMVSRLNALTGEATSPIADGVRHKAIINPATRSSGVVATLVPENDSAPYMAKLGEHRYFKRSGDSFYRMEHFDLEDMFGRRRKAKLRVRSDYASDGDIEKISLVIENVGRAVARFPGFIASFENVLWITVDGLLKNISYINKTNPTAQYENNVGVIHPNGIPVYVGSVGFKRRDPSHSVKAVLTIYCEGAPPTWHTIEL